MCFVLNADRASSFWFSPCTSVLNGTVPGPVAIAGDLTLFRYSRRLSRRLAGGRRRGADSRPFCKGGCENYRAGLLFASDPAVAALAFTGGRSAAPLT